MAQRDQTHHPSVSWPIVRVCNFGISSPLSKGYNILACLATCLLYVSFVRQWKKAAHRDGMSNEARRGAVASLPGRSGNHPGSL